MAISNVFSQPMCLKIVLFNMHSFSQGSTAVAELIRTISPNVFLVPEHWLTPTILHKFNDYFPDYFAFGFTAMSKQVESSVLRGRPFGGLVNLVKNDLRNVT